MRYVIALTFALCLTTAPSQGGDRLHAGQALGPGQRLTSPNGRYALDMLTDGNLILHRGNQVLWCSNTRGTEGGTCIVGRDGNVGVYEVLKGQPPSRVAWNLGEE